MISPVTLTPVPSDELRSSFGDIDIYLFDQILKGRFDDRLRVLDAGCGDGRNLIYFLRRGFTCFGVDRDGEAVRRVKALAARLAPELPGENFQVGELDDLPWRDAAMDAVVCSAVLHFAEDEAHFAAMLEEMWRVLAPNGLFFARLASSIGLESRIGIRIPVGRVSGCACRTAQIASSWTRRCCSNGPTGWAASCWTRSRRPTSSSSAR